MELKEMIHSYVTDSIEEKTRYNTDFGIGVFTTINYLHWGEYPTIHVNIRNGKSKHFNMNESKDTDVVSWIYDNVK